MTEPANEQALLTEYLDHFRGEIVRKLAGLSDEQACRRLVPSPTSLAGIVKHLRWVELYWFQRVLAGIEWAQLPTRPWTAEDRDADWRIEPGETVAGLIAEYQAQCARSRETAARYPLDAVGRHGGSKTPREPQPITLREILLHMVDETARHAGQADILRELIDGATGG